MSKKRNVKGNKKDNKKQDMTISIMALAAVFIVELYLMMNQPTEYFSLGLVALIILVVVYRIIDIAFKMQDEKATKSEKEYENLFKSQRMSYLLMKENFEDMYVLLKEIEDNSDIPIEDLIESQKAVAKVTIHRNKENATALMNSNEKLVEKMLDFEALLKKNMHMSGAAGETEENIKVEMPMAEESETAETEMPMTEASETAETEMPMAEESTTVETETPVAEESETAEMEMPMAGESETAEVEMPMAGESETAETEMPMAEESETVEAEMPVAEENEETANEVQTSVSDDPNHVMSPDEIAKLLGEVNEMTEAENTEEEKPQMPVSDDPNHVMSPDEIAALLGNL